MKPSMKPSMKPPMKLLLSVEDLSVQFSTPRGMARGVEGISFTLRKGEIFALLGETGCGKSVTGRAIMGLLGENAAIGGSIYFKDQDLLTRSEKELSRIRGSEMSIILQNPDLALNPVLTVGRQLMEPLKRHLKMTTAQAKEQVINRLDQMGFVNGREIFRLYPFQLSGGMNQRVLIAAALLTGPQLLIADEPTRALDAELKGTIQNQLIACRDDFGTAILLITHHLDLASALAQRVGVMVDGQLVEVNDMSAFMEKPRHPYSIALMESYRGNGFSESVNEGPIKPSFAISSPIPPSAPPAPSSTPLSEGCSYVSRCPFSKPFCRKVKPELVPVENGEVRCLLMAE